MLWQFVHQSLTEVTGNARHSARMLILQGWLAVLVGASEGSRGKDILRVTLEVTVVDDMLALGRIGQVDKLFILTQSLFVLILLNDD